MHQGEHHATPQHDHQEYTARWHGGIGASLHGSEQLAKMLEAYTGRDDILILILREKRPLLSCATSCAANSAACGTCIKYSERSTSTGYFLLQPSSYLSVRRYAPDSESNGKIKHLSTK